MYRGKCSRGSEGGESTATECNADRPTYLPHFVGSESPEDRVKTVLLNRLDVVQVYGGLVLEAFVPTEQHLTGGPVNG